MASHLQEIPQCHLFRFVWSVSFRPTHSSVSASQLCVLGIQQAADIGTDKHRVRPVRLPIFCLYGRDYTPQQFIATFTTGHPNRHVHLFPSVFGPPRPREEVRTVLGYVRGTYLDFCLAFVVCMAAEWNLQSIMLLLKGQEMKLSSRNWSLLATMSLGLPFQESLWGNTENTGQQFLEYQQHSLGGWQNPLFAVGSCPRQSHCRLHASLGIRDRNVRFPLRPDK